MVSIRWFAAIAIVACSAASCMGQIHPMRYGMVYTLEWLVAQADVVVIAQLSGDLPVESGAWFKVKAQAMETLKGELSGNFDFAIPHDRNLASAYRGRKVLLFLHRKSISPGPEGISPSPFNLYGQTAAWSMNSVDGEAQSFAVTMDLAVHTRPETIVEATRSAVTHDRGRSKPKTYRIVSVPFRTELCRWVNGLNLPAINLPRDERLEQAAHQWTKSSNIFVRVEGVTALRLFRSDENIQLLKGLLWDAGVEGGRTLVREASTNVLKSWGMEVADPGAWRDPQIPK